MIGAALNQNLFENKNPQKTQIVKRHFSAITPENCMKPAPLQPREGEFRFEVADKYVDFGLQNGMFIVGHTLIWHNQLPEWFWKGEDGKNASPDLLKKRMKTHIQTVVGRYKGKVRGWDVVNEAIEDDGSFRKSKFYEILGEEYIELAFKYANGADPDAELYYNDYNMAKKPKREAVCHLVKKLKSKGVKIDAVGMQAHISMNYPDIKDFEESISAFAAAGVKVMITELDMTALPSAWGVNADLAKTHEYKKKYDPYTDGLPPDVSQKWNKRMAEFFEMFKRNSDKISRVCFWGVFDDDSWLNYFPVRSRTDYPLPFDRNLQPKAFVVEILNADK
ncbi:MAG: endo-1,4-beta-xylanase [Opitutales bacterium]|nr:endo-1,4-beta-xylanase [Opitutales bacterium]